MDISAVAVCLAAIVLGGGFTIVVARAIRGGPVVTTVLIGSYALRVALAVVLYLISVWHLPILPELHMQDGFWRFGRDAQAYHWVGIVVADSFRWGTELPGFQNFGEPDFFLLTGGLYSIVGANPLLVPLLNAAMWTGILWGIYALAQRLTGPPAGTYALLLAAALPSTYVWSAQIMKDTLVLLLIVALLTCVVVIVEEKRGSRRMLLSVLALIAVAFLLARLRWYIIVLAIGALATVAVMRLIASSPRGRLAVSLVSTALIAILAAILVVGRGFDPVSFLSPQQPELGHLRKAQFLESNGNLEAATWEYLRAGGLVPAVPAPGTGGIQRPQQPTASIERLVTAKAAVQPKPPPPVVVAAVPPKQPPVAVASQPNPAAAVAAPIPARVPAAATAVEVLPRVSVMTRLSRTLAGGKAQLMRVLADGRAQLSRLVSFATVIRVQRGFDSVTSRGGGDGRTSDLPPINSYGDIALQLPQIVAVAFWSPFPWQWFAGTGDTGVFRHFAAVEVVMLLALTPWLFFGCVRGLRGRRDAAWLLIAFSGATAILLGLLATNIGALFRLRLQFLLPAIVIAAAYGAQSSKLAAWFSRD